LPAYKVLQYGCGVGGLAFVAWAAWAWLCRQPATSDVEVRFSPLAHVCLLSVLAVVIPGGCVLRAWQVAAGSAALWHVFAFELVTTTFALQAAAIVAARALLRPRETQRLD
jgi:hypothetical protein